MVRISDRPVVLDLDGRPISRRSWFESLWAHREATLMLARADFQVRFKRTAFGIAWALIVPLVQSIVLAVVFSKLIPVGTGSDFAAYVLSGVLAWTYFSQSLSAGATSIVDAAGITDKVWFPRAILSITPAVANLPGFVISLVLLAPLLPVLGAPITWRLLLLPVAIVVVVLFVTGLALVLSALNVYFRDVRFIVQAGLLVWFYVTPIAYPAAALGDLERWADLNPMTGVVTMFRLATVGADDWMLPLAVTFGFIAVLLVAAVEAHRRHDRLFVDLL